MSLEPPNIWTQHGLRTMLLRAALGVGGDDACVRTSCQQYFNNSESKAHVI